MIEFRVLEVGWGCRAACAKAARFPEAFRLMPSMAGFKHARQGLAPTCPNRQDTYATFFAK